MIETSDSLVLCAKGEDLSILLVRRANGPYRDFWALPGGFAEKGEDSFLACLRELREETGLDLTGREKIPLSLYQKEGRDPRGPTRTSPYYFHLEERVSVKAADDAKEARWFKLCDLDLLAFDHAQMLLEVLGKTFAYMPHYDAHFATLDLTYPFKKFLNKEVSSLCFFPGTFGPWHEGHSECVRQLLNFDSRIKLVILQDKNPWKNEKEQNFDSTQTFKRYKDLVLKFQKEERVEVCPALLSGEEDSYTSSWITKTHIKERSLLLGDDTFLDLKLWRDYPSILTCLAQIFVVPRLSLREKLDTFASELLNDHSHLKIHILSPHPFQNLSSHALKNR